jgi:hypothetical protein
VLVVASLGQLGLCVVVGGEKAKQDTSGVGV